MKPGFENTIIQCKPFPCSVSDLEEMERQCEELLKLKMVKEFTMGEAPKHSSPAFLVAKAGGAKRMVCAFGQVNKATYCHAGSLPDLHTLCQRISTCKFKSKLDLRSGFWQVDLTKRAADLLCFKLPNGRIFQWQVMPFGVSSAPAVFQELMGQVMADAKRRPELQAVLKNGGQLE